MPKERNKPTNEDDQDILDDVMSPEDTQEEVAQDNAPTTPYKNKRTRGPRLPGMKTASDKGSNDPFYLQPGDTISLNMKQRAMIMFPLPGNRIFRMNSHTWSIEIPEDTPPEWLKALMLLYEQGDIIKGTAFCPKYPKNPEVMKRFQKYLDLPLDQMVKQIKPLVLHRGLVEGYRSCEILMAMMRYEQDHFHRKQYINIINEALEHIGGVGPITQSPVQNLTIEEAGSLAEDIY